jgi:ATP-binding cassette subfamily B protein
MVIASFAEIISIGAVVPFLGVLIAPENIFNNPSLHPLIAYFGFTSPEDLVLPITLIFIAASLLSALIRIFVTWLNIRLSFKIGVEFSIKMFSNSLYQPYSNHVDTNSSEIINTITAKATATIFNYLMPILTILSSSILIISIMYTLAYINPFVAIYSFGGIGLVYIVISNMTSYKLNSNGKLVANLTTKVIKTVQESLGGIRDVILDGTQKTFINVFS